MASRISLLLRGYAPRSQAQPRSLVNTVTARKKNLSISCDHDVKSFSGTPESESYCVSEPLLSRSRGLQRTCLYDHARP